MAVGPDLPEPPNQEKDVEQGLLDEEKLVADRLWIAFLSIEVVEPMLFRQKTRYVEFLIMELAKKKLG